MGFWDFFKLRSKEHIEEFWPGGKILQVHVEYDTQSQGFTYYGRYGLRFDVGAKEITDMAIREVSRTHSVVQIFKGQDCVGTTDVLPTEACAATKEWMERFR